MKDIYNVLKEINIEYTKHEHPAVYTVEEAEIYYKDIKAGHCKNLFLRNKKGDKHYLVVVEGSKRVNLKQLALLLQEHNLSFASPERLMKYLGLTPGSVSPFGLINDESKEVKVVVDKDLLKFEQLGYHPNSNTATLVLRRVDFEKFLIWTNNSLIYLNM